MHLSCNGWHAFKHDNVQCCSWLDIHGRTYMAGHTWQDTHGRTYMTEHTWQDIHDRTHMAGHT